MHPFLPKPLLLGTRGTLNTIGVVVLISLFFGCFFTNHLQRTCRANVNMACPTSRQSSPFWWSQFLEAATKKACKNKRCDGPKKKMYSITPKKLLTHLPVFEKKLWFCLRCCEKEEELGVLHFLYPFPTKKISWFVMNIVYQARCSPFVWWFEEVVHYNSPTKSERFHKFHLSKSIKITRSDSLAMQIQTTMIPPTPLLLKSLKLYFFPPIGGSNKVKGFTEKAEEVEYM